MVREVENGGNMDIKPYMDTLQKIKNGEDTINIFNINSKNKLSSKLEVVVDPPITNNEDDYGKIKETHGKTDEFDPEKNNEKTENIEFIKKGPFIVLPVYVGLASEKEDLSIVNIAFKVAKKNYEFMKKVYPLDPTKSKLSNGTKISIGASKEMLDNPDTKKRLAYKKILRKMIFRRLQELAEQRKVNLIIGMVDPEKILEDENGIGHKSIPKYNKVVLLQVKRDSDNRVIDADKQSEYSVAHEYGHVLQPNLWPEQYKKYPTFGLPASNGWCLDQDTGEDCGARINIWTKFVDGMLSSSFDYNEASNDLATRVGFRYYDIMGTGGGHTWVLKDPTYGSLLIGVK